MRITTLLAFVLLLNACGEAGGKGVEDAIPADGKADSFRSPTEHGRLAFGGSDTAELDGEAHFHAWEFRLTGEAHIAVDITVDDFGPNQNLDTVAYLYSRMSEDENWGSYIARNDNANAERLTSRVEDRYDAGLYRVIVKGYKLAERGSFRIGLECIAGACGEVNDIEFPTETGYGGACDDPIDNVFRSNALGSDRYTLDVSTPSAIDALQGEDAVAVALYRDHSGSAWARNAEDGVNVRKELFEEGSVVTLGFGGDEDSVSYVFNNDFGLVFSYQHGGAQDMAFYCGEGEEPEPGVNCISELLFGAVRDEANTRIEHGLYSYYGDNTDLHPMLRAAGDEYSREIEVDGLEETDSEFEVSATVWEHGADVRVDGINGPATYFVVSDGHDEGYVVLENLEDGDSSFLICEPFSE